MSGYLLLALLFANLCVSAWKFGAYLYTTRNPPLTPEQRVSRYRRVAAQSRRSHP